MTTNRTSLEVAHALREFERGIDPGVTGHWVAEVARKYLKMEDAIREVLADSESRDGGWGPDTTMRGALQEALTFDPFDRHD